jgi:MFS superfamily sulfate permease-like transporter
MGIALACGVPPAMGLLGGIIGGLIVGSIAGSPLQVSGPAAGLIVLVAELVKEYGLEGLAVATLLGGLLQATAGKLKFGAWFQAVAPAVIHGMLAGIGVLIFASQFHFLVDDVARAGGIANIVAIPESIMKGITPVDGSHHTEAAFVASITMGILILWNVVREHAPAAIKLLPAPLLAIVVAVAVSKSMELPINYVKVPNDIFELFRFPSFGDFHLLIDPAFLAAAVGLAVIASAESMLCAVAVDKLHDGPRSDLNQELFAQGIGNMTAGLIGSLPITGVIVRSTANIEAGGKTRVSAMLHAVWLFLAIAVAPKLLALVPNSALAAILVYIGYRLVNPAVMRNLWSHGRAEFYTYAVTVVAIVATNLLEGLMIGLFIAIIRLAWTFSSLDVETSQADGQHHVRLSGAATFVSLPGLVDALDEIASDAKVEIHLDECSFIDHACVELLTDQEKLRSTSGGELIISWPDVQARSTPLRPTVAA